LKRWMLIGPILLACQATGGEVGTLPHGDCDKLMPRHDYRHCDLNGRSLHGIDMSESLLQGVNLQNVKITDCRLDGAQLQGADLKWAVLTGR
jgi:uncharacterized protein YjbI with pentapeptide repeats